MKKRKVKRYDEGGVLTDRYGDPVKSGSGETVRTKYGSKDKSETVDDIQDYASLGRRAGATSSFSGPREYITESKEDEIEPPKGIASGFNASNYLENLEPKGGGPISKTEPQAKPKPIKNITSSKVKPPDEDEIKAERRMAAIGDQYIKDKKALAEKKARENADLQKAIGLLKSQRVVPKATSEEMELRKKMERSQALENVSPEMALIGGPSLRVVKGAAEALAARQGVKQAIKKRVEPSFRDIKDITPQAERIGIAPRQIGREPPKIGMKSGGKVSSASFRGDGIAQRGKTKGRIC